MLTDWRGSRLSAPVLFLLALLVLSGCASVGGEGTARFLMPDTQTLTAGSPVTDQLGLGEPANAKDGSAYRTYTVDIEAGYFLLATAESHDFDPVLTLYGPDGTFLTRTESRGYYGYGDPSAELSRRIVRSGEYTLVVSGSDNSDAGIFELDVETLQEDGQLAFPGAVTSILAAGGGESHPYTGAPMSVYPLTLDEATHVEITLMSEAFDAYLSLVDAETGDELASNDDMPGSSDSRIRMELSAGDYDIQATGYFSDSSGRFTLRAEAYEPPTPEPFEMGRDHTGHMGMDRMDIPNSDRSGNGYEFTLSEDAIVDIEMTSSEVDAYLYVTDAEGVLVGEDDDSGQGLDARLLMPLDAGDYTLWASTFGGHANGQYQLLTEVIDPEDFSGPFIGDYRANQQASVPSEPIEPEALTLGDAFEGEIGTRRMAIPNAWSEGLPHEFTIDEPIVLDLVMTSDVVDPYLYLTDSAGVIVGEDDDSAGSLDARLLMPLEPGTYTAWASTFNEFDEGPYRLETEVHDPETFDGTFIGDYIHGDGGVAGTSSCGCGGW